jgi:hypothetical protein
VLDDETAFLAEPNPRAFGAAILKAIQDPAVAALVGERARALAEEKYSEAAYMSKTSAALGLLNGRRPEQVARGAA